MDTTFTWFQNYPWQIAFGAMLFLFVCCPFWVVRRRLQALLGQASHWQELEQNINELDQEQVRFFPNPTRQVLLTVLSSQKGAARAGAASPALDYLAAEVESPIRTLRSLSYLSVLIGLLGTVTLLALALQRVEVLSQFSAQQLKNIYPINAVAIGLAVAIYLSYSWYQHRGDQFILKVARVLGRLKTDQLGDADPGLLAALEKVGEKFKEWGDDIQARHLEKLHHLIQEMRELGESIRLVATEAIAMRQEEEQAVVPLLRSQEAKLELLSYRLDQSNELLAQLAEGKLDLASLEAHLGDFSPGSEGRGEMKPKKPGIFSRVFR